MLKNEKLSKYIHCNSWNKFIVILNYKAKRNGIELIRADRFYASSQICSVCGHVNKEVKDLRIRERKENSSGLRITMG
jgi:putative transposase